MSGTVPLPPATAPADPIGGALRRSQSRHLMARAVALLASEVEWFVRVRGAFSGVQASDKAGVVHFAGYRLFRHRENMSDHARAF